MDELQLYILFSVTWILYVDFNYTFGPISKRVSDFCLCCTCITLRKQLTVRVVGLCAKAVTSDQENLQLQCQQTAKDF